MEFLINKSLERFYSTLFLLNLGEGICGATSLEVRNTVFKKKLENNEFSMYTPGQYEDTDPVEEINNLFRQTGKTLTEAQFKDSGSEIKIEKWNEDCSYTLSDLQ